MMSQFRGKGDGLIRVKYVLNIQGFRFQMSSSNTTHLLTLTSDSCMLHRLAINLAIFFYKGKQTKYQYPILNNTENTLILVTYC